MYNGCVALIATYKRRKCLSFNQDTSSRDDTDTKGNPANKK